MADFAAFDQRGYRTVSAGEGYGGWAATYENSVLDAMDIELLAGLHGVAWAAGSRVADPGCGTGRIGKWPHDRGIRAIDGVDLTPEMVAIARSKSVYRDLRAGDVPHFIMVSGMPTHYTNSDGEPIAIETHLHLISDALDAGWMLAEMQERVIGGAWIASKPK